MVRRQGGASLQVRPWSAASFAVLFLLVWLIYQPVLTMPPFEGDNLYVLSTVDRLGPIDLLRGDPEIYPEWRPLAYFSVWLQYRWASIDRVWSYYAINILLWVLCGWIVNRLVLAISGSSVAALASTALVVTSPLLIDSVVLIVERQTTLACVFGLSAWLIVARAGPAAMLAPVEWVSVSLLLLASALSKEYGLAFAGALAVFAYRHGLRHLLAGAIGAIGIYAALRIAFSGGALAILCEDQGYFFTQRYEVCFDRINATIASQALYNVVASAIGSVLPGLFAPEGTIRIWPRWLLMSSIVLAMAAVGWTKGPPSVRVGLLVIAFNAALSVLLYRSRNHAVALCALGVAVGSGLTTVWTRRPRLVSPRVVRTSAALLVLTLVSLRVIEVREFLRNSIAEGSRPNPCTPDVPVLDIPFMERVWNQYNMRLPECPER
jgi:hypothetical protein